jgi:hypothetical protein
MFRDHFQARAFPKAFGTLPLAAVGSSVVNVLSSQCGW